MKNVIISTTHGFNVGDDFVRHGCQYLLSRITTEPINYFFWNRNPDLDNKDSFHSNSLSNHRLIRSSNWDLIVFAGTPEWTGHRLYNLNKFILNNTEIPILFLGIGNNSPYDAIDDDTSRILKQSRTFAIARNNSLGQRLNCTVLPCPALYVADYFSIKNKEQKNKLFNFQVDKNAMYQSIPIERLNNILHYTKDKEFTFITHYVEEALFALNNNLNFVYSPIVYDLISSYATGGSIISTRLHGGIAGLSCEVPSIVLGEHDHRIHDTAKVFGNLLPVTSVKNAMDMVETFDTRTIKLSIKQLKQNVLGLYISILSDFLKW